jgi:aldehyde dehydrogenase (NAD+)
MRIVDTVYINGEFVIPQGDQWVEITNPATEEVIGRARMGDERDIDQAVDAARAAFAVWRQSTVEERIVVLRRLSALAAEHQDAFASTMIEEFGGPSQFVHQCMVGTGIILESYATTLESFDFVRDIGGAKVAMVPVGVVGAIIPWNCDIPFLCNKIGTAIAAGCSIVIKPSEFSALQTQAFIECLHKANLLPGLVNIVNGTGAVAGARLSSHPDIAKIAFTGSVATGQAIMRAAADTMKRITLELGGKSPSVLLDDVDLEEALPHVLGLGFINNGQVCAAGTRVLVPEARMEEALAAIKEAVEAIKVGPTSDPEVGLGPVASRTQFDRVQDYIELGLKEGAVLVTGGPGRHESQQQGWFVKPTVFAGDNRMRIAQEEIFGPVLCVIPYRDEEEAIAIANDTKYGLKAYVFGSDSKRAFDVANRIDAGQVLVNGAPFSSMAPFGGFKMSGIGRENGVAGLESHLELRAVIAAESIPSTFSSDELPVPTH